MELWKIIEDCPLYEVSDNGRIKNRRTGRILSPRAAGKGYRKVTLCDSYGHHERYIHRLVADAFLDERYGNEINHKDGDKTNNRVSNLEWCDRLYNVRNAIDFGLTTPYVGTPGKPVRILETGETFPSIRECARAIDGDHQHIIDCLTGRARSHKGYHYEYV